MGNIVAMVFFLLMYMTSFFVSSSDVPTSQRTAASLSTHTGYSFALNLFVLVDSEASGISYSNISLLVQKYSVSIYIGIAFVNIIFFLVLGLYLD